MLIQHLGLLSMTSYVWISSVCEQLLLKERHINENLLSSWVFWLLVSSIREYDENN